MVSRQPINLKQLIYKTAASERANDMPADPFDDELDMRRFEDDKAEDIKRGAKVWMASVKYVAPASAISMALTDSPEKADKLVNVILELSSGAAFSNVADAYSCGASFNEQNVFGVYRYSLASASSCTALLAYLTNKVVPDFSKFLGSHLVEIASGVKPLSRRSTPSEAQSHIGNTSYKNKLNRYINSLYPHSDISSKASLATSTINALSKTLSNYETRLKAIPPTKRVEDVLNSLVVDTIEKWVYHSENATNGNVLAGADQKTRVMIVQNALNLVVTAANSTIDRVSGGSDAFIYGADVIEQLNYENEKTLTSIMKKTNAYASVFAKNEHKIFEAIEEFCLPYTRPLNSEITPNGWLRLFELPGLLVKYVAQGIVEEKMLSHRNMAATIDSIMEGALAISEAISVSIHAEDDWAFKELTDAAIEYKGELSLMDVDLSDDQVQLIAKAGQAVVAQANDKGLGWMLESRNQPAINPVRMVGVKYAGQSLKLLSLLTGRQDSRMKFEAIASLNALAFDKAVEIFINIQQKNDSADSNIMMLGCAINAANTLVFDALKYEIRSNVSSNQTSVINDIVMGSDLLQRIKTNVFSQSEMLIKVSEHALDRVTAITLKGDVSKKHSAVVPEISLSEQPAAMVI